MNRISVLFFLVYLVFLFIHEIDKLRVMCGMPLNEAIVNDVYFFESKYQLK